MRASYFFKTPYTALLLLSMFTACAQGKVKQPSPQATAGYMYKAASADGTGIFYYGRELAPVMGSGGGDWLERPTRQQEEAVDSVIAKMPLQVGSMVADIGAGTGYYTFRIAPKIAPGFIYAIEVQPPFIKALEEKKQQVHQQNVQVVRGTDSSLNLPNNTLDLAFMVDVYHELRYPQQMLQSVYKALKPGGHLLLVEYRGEDPSIPIKPLHKMTIAQANKELEASGFHLQRLDSTLPIQHFLLYQKAAQ